MNDKLDHSDFIFHMIFNSNIRKYELYHVSPNHDSKSECSENGGDSSVTCNDCKLTIKCQASITNLLYLVNHQQKIFDESIEQINKKIDSLFGQVDKKLEIRANEILSEQLNSCNSLIDNININK